MKLGLLSLAALTMGVSVIAPAAARADHDDRDRGEGRGGAYIGREYWRDGEVSRERDGGDRGGEGHHHHRRDSERPVSLRDVPPDVLNTALRHGNGRHVDSALRVRRKGESFYILHMAGARKVHIDVHVAADGCLIAIERLGRR